jgi:Uncharacterized protein conserved in bacteria (DUF2252)
MLGWERIVAIDGETKDFYPPTVGREELGRHRAVEPRRPDAHGVICGWTLARAHARSGDAVAIAAYLGTGDTLDRAMASFGETYADQNERDYQGLEEAAQSGRVAVETGI